MKHGNGNHNQRRQLSHNRTPSPGEHPETTSSWPSVLPDHNNELYPGELRPVPKMGAVPFYFPKYLIFYHFSDCSRTSYANIVSKRDLRKNAVGASFEKQNGARGDGYHGHGHGKSRIYRCVAGAASVTCHAWTSFRDVTY